MASARVDFSPARKESAPVINSKPVAIELQLDSPLRKKIDGALIALREKGDYQQIYDKWFGVP
jgi:polar amino acid transport system substrate-binding protein